jgi:hypothetical protein
MEQLFIDGKNIKWDSCLYGEEILYGTTAYMGKKYYTAAYMKRNAKWNNCL